MIIWINGAFGSGKTNVAYELSRRIENSYVYDPEEIGYFIQKNIPEKLKLNDFQEFFMWRQINYEILKYISDYYDGIIIVPMTIVNDAYYKEIIGRLRQENIEVRHFTLRAKKETLLKRLKKRGDGKNSWPVKQIDRCIAALDNPMFKEHINTDNMSIYQVVDYIGNLCNIELLPDNRNWIQKKMYKLEIFFRHIRILR